MAQPELNTAPRGCSQRGLRIGQGYDLHRMVACHGDPSVTPLTLGGVVVSETLGTLAHSDGDVVLHALIDALLGATAQGDIGDHFPPSEERYKNASSSELLKTVLALPALQNVTIINVDSTIFLETPKLGPYKQAIAKNLVTVLGLVSNSQVSVKAKTLEKLGPIGEGVALAASVTVLLELV